MKLIGELRKEKEFRQQCCRNSTKVGERKRKSWRKKRNFGNTVTEIPLPKMLPVQLKEKQLRQRHCQNRKKNFFGNCGNGIAENGKKKLNGIMAMSLPKMGGKKKFVLAKKIVLAIVAMPLPKMEKKNYEI